MSESLRPPVVFLRSFSSPRKMGQGFHNPVSIKWQKYKILTVSAPLGIAGIWNDWVYAHVCTRTCSEVCKGQMTHLGRSFLRYCAPSFEMVFLTGLEPTMTITWHRIPLFTGLRPSRMRGSVPTELLSPTVSPHWNGTCLG